MRYEIYRDGKDEWRWRSIAANGEQLGSSSEGYTDKRDALAGIRVQQRITDIVMVLKDEEDLA